MLPHHLVEEHILPLVASLHALPTLALVSQRWRASLQLVRVWRRALAQRWAALRLCPLALRLWVHWDVAPAAWSLKSVLLRTWRTAEVTLPAGGTLTETRVRMCRRGRQQQIEGELQELSVDPRTEQGWYFLGKCRRGAYHGPRCVVVWTTGDASVVYRGRVDNHYVCGAGVFEVGGEGGGSVWQ